MIKVKSRNDLFGVQKTEQPKSPVPDVVSKAMESLANQVQLSMQMISHVAESQKETGRQLLTLAQERKPPARLDAEVVRDKSGKMTKVVITPIHN